VNEPPDPATVRAVRTDADESCTARSAGAPRGGRAGPRLFGIAAFVALALVTAGCSSGPANSSSTTTSSSSTSSAGGRLSVAEVKALQTALAKVACFSGSIDGAAGPATTRAVRSFQEAAGLPADGVYGPSTRAELLAAAKNGTRICSKTAPTTTTTVPATTSTDAAAAMAPCTATAVGEALPAGETLVSFRCVSGWAAGAMQNPQYESAFLLQSRHRVWVQPPPNACADSTALGIPEVILAVSPCKVS